MGTSAQRISEDKENELLAEWNVRTKQKKTNRHTISPLRVVVESERPGAPVDMRRHVNQLRRRRY